MAEAVAIGSGPAYPPLIPLPEPLRTLPGGA